MTAIEMDQDIAGKPRARYAPIEDYALIGDCHGAALVSRDGSIDWAALHRFDADPVFCKVLDADRGGFWSIRPIGSYACTRAYLPGTNILRTVFSARSGSAAVTDFMPVGRRLDARVNDYVHLSAPAWIVRRIEGLQGTLGMAVEYRPAGNYARAEVVLQLAKRAVRAGVEMPTLFGDAAYELRGDCANAVIDVAAGARHDFVLADNTVEGEFPCGRADEFFATTRAFWEEWIGYCRYRGPHEAMVRRSALALKLLTFAPTGAIVAAPTTSLPEAIGGTRNWDYRFCWVRDASFALYALSVLGYSGEAQCFHDFLLGACARSLPCVRPMYGIDGALKLDETTLEHLEGYRASAPVRCGNGAYLQQQIDVYGQVLDLALMYEALGGRLHEQYRRLLAAVAKFVAAHWREPDQGIWEMRGDARHHVHGKLMSWVAMDRASRLVGGGEWRAEAARIAAEIDLRGGPSAGDGLRQAYDGGTDAAVLLAPMLGFPMSPETLTLTIARVRRELGRGDFVDRYHGEDGLEGGEGAFLVCTSWLIDAELAAGRIEPARAMIEHLIESANDVGLYAEEVETAGGAFLGNFPQALTHLGIIGNLVNLQLAERRGAAALAGSYAHRARQVVTATFGWRGVLAAMWQSRRLGRIVSSRRSKLAWP
ncbi:MAG: glycoside hydrolase family 15 protein [Casimicrobiaceae bacterium]